MRPGHDRGRRRFKARTLCRRGLLSMAAALALTRRAAAQSTRSVRYRATIDGLDGRTLSLTTRAGQQVTMTLPSDAVILAIVPMKLEDIGPGAYIGSAAMPRPDGTQRALEVHVFPENMRGTGVGHRPFDLERNSTMTNGTVGAVSGTSERKLKVAYPDGEKIIVVPPDTPVVTFEPGSRDLLVKGAHCIVSGTEAPDGTLSVIRILVGKDGLVPPM